MKRTLLTLATALFAGLIALGTPTFQTRAQEPSDIRQLDEKQLKDNYDRLQRHRFYRHASDVYDNVLRLSQIDPDRVTVADRFVQAFYEGRWDEIRNSLQQFPEDMANSIYDRMLGDMAGRYVPVLSLDDFVGLSDASPSELNADRVRKLGLLLRAAVAPEQQIWLKKALQKGTRYLGEGDTQRTVTGRVLMHGGFDDLARAYLPNVVEASQIGDAEIRDEILQFLDSQAELDDFQQTQISGLWQRQADVLLDPTANSTDRQQAADRLAELLGRAGLASVEPLIRSLAGRNLDATLGLATALGKRAQGKTNDNNVPLRTHNLQAQKTLLQCVAEHTELSKSPWDSVAIAMADGWISEAEHTFAVHPSYRDTRPKPHVAPGDLVEAGPEGVWAQALPDSLQERIDICLAKAVLVSDRYQDAVQRIVTLAKRNPEAGALMAEEYLQAWASRHDPHVPEAVRKQYQLAADARIVVTPIMMEKNIADLAEIMRLFRAGDIRPGNAELLVGAFDVCYSNAEAYQSSHIEKVFGPIDQMDEDIFLHMIRMMTRGLSSQWREMGVQEAAGTRRSQSETLAMVRSGYQAALAMIDQRSQQHPDAWRVLALAGSLLSDWADFEYYQQLVADSSADRMEAFREKNNSAREYFAQAAEAYARGVADLGPGRYSIEAYLAWFHSLLGINSNGALNLSKPLDRQALNTLREAMRALPGGAGQAHVNLLAKHVQARMEDAENPLHEELKYKYLAGSLVLTQDSPFAFQATDKVSYYDQLLDEIRLETRVDGPNTIHREHEFGIILSVYHTEAMGRMANFGQYLTNELPPSNAPSRSSQPILATYKATPIQGRRDELEMNIREALGLFFDIRAVAFSPADVQPRPTERAGWEETVLAYIHLKAKDCSVDKIPRVQVNLEFLDLTGPVSISAESAETMIKVTDQPTAPRPFDRVDLTQVLDARDLQSSEEILLEIAATACGLVPEIDQLLDLPALEQQLPIARIDPHEGTLLRQVNSWGDTVHAVSERQWTIALDAASLIDPPGRIALQLPAARCEASTANRAYIDMDLVDLQEPVANVGPGSAAASPTELVERSDRRVQYAAAAGGGLLLLVLLAVAVRWLRGSGDRPLRARDVFRMPEQIDGFVIVQLLRALDTSHLVRLSPERRTELQHEIHRVQDACFGGNGSAGMPEEELRNVARKWLKIAC
jgi:hypothetical protein